jgi:hypothetical protein
MENSKITNFTDLKTWQEAHKLALLVYKFTVKFPAEEKFGLINQMKRAAVSVPSNIAEGFSRGSSKDKMRVADFPTACRGYLVGRFGNPRFPK